MASNNANNLAMGKPFPPAVAMEAAGGAGSNTTFVQADPSTFRAVVQRLTGPDDPSTAKLPVTSPSPTRHSSAAARFLSSAAAGADFLRPPPSFKLHERRQGGVIRKLDLKPGGGGGCAASPASPYGRCRSLAAFPCGEAVAAPSPVSPLDLFSPKTPSFDEEEEERRVIAEKGFYCLQPSPLSTPRGRGGEPELLPLFPLTSPRDCSSPSS